MTRAATVSAVIPTRNRPDLVMRAVRSALAQQYEDMEVIVVIDGPDALTTTVLNEIHDRRLRVIALPETRGAANARNAGVASATGDWIAFLDDDDEWLPEKTSLQMESAKSSRFQYPIVSCQLFARTKSYQIVWPRRRPCEPLCNYLLARNSWSYGDGLLSTTTLLFPKDLFSAAAIPTEFAAPPGPGLGTAGSEMGRRGYRVCLETAGGVAPGGGPRQH